jgi:hypothetical protein
MLMVRNPPRSKDSLKARRLAGYSKVSKITCATAHDNMTRLRTSATMYQAATPGSRYVELNETSGLRARRKYVQYLGTVSCARESQFGVIVGTHRLVLEARGSRCIDAARDGPTYAFLTGSGHRDASSNLLGPDAFTAEACLISSKY